MKYKWSLHRARNQWHYYSHLQKIVTPAVWAIGLPDESLNYYEAMPSCIHQGLS